MTTALLSINPQHVDRIIDGSKKFEFRKVRARREISRILIYSTAPVAQVVAEVEVTGVVDGSPASVWERARHAAGISRDFYDLYYEGRNRAVAYELGRVKAFGRPKSLSEFGISCPPQSFVYI
jgi:predicted transcriptional regulator